MATLISNWAKTDSKNCLQKFATVDAALIAIVALAAVLRFTGLGASALWYDEAFSLAMTRLPLFEMVRTSASDFNPPLWELIAWVSTRLFGVNEIGLRLPATIASIAALVVAGRWVKAIAPHWVYLGLATLAILPYQLWMAQDGRVYAVMSLLYIAGAWFVFTRRWLGLAATCGLLLYCHMTGAFYAATLLALALWQWQDWYVVRTGLVTFTSFLPWLASYIHAAADKQFWLGPFTFGKFATAFMRAFIADTLPAALWPVAALAIVGGIAGALVLTRRDTLPLMLVALGPLALMMALAPFKNVIFYRPLSAMTIPLVMWLAVTLPNLPGVFPKSFAGLLWAVMLIAGLTGWSPAMKGGELRALTDRINIDAMRPGDVFYHATATSAIPFSFYVRGYSYVLDERQDDGLLSWDMQDALSIQRAALEDVPHKRAWVFWAEDPIMSDAAKARMARYIKGGVLIGTVHTWQAAPIQVWLVER